jgi:hypothetical protein
MIRVRGEPIERKPVTGKLRATVTKPASVTKPKGGRPKVHASDAERQRAYRKRSAARP